MCVLPYVGPPGAAPSDALAYMLGLEGSMINFPNESVAAGFSVADAIDLVFAFGNPNPDRCGCPAPAIVQALAVRALPIGHPGYEHLVCCSPCYREFRALQRRCGQC